MLNIQKRYIEFLNKLLENSKDLEQDKSKIENLINEIKEVELLIPIIGGFSSGKSTLLNSFLHKDYLPVGIVPETDLAAELRYSEIEFIEAVKENNEMDKYEINEWDKIKQNAENYSFLRVYINQENLKKIEPLILVDMPGFEAPIKSHHKAIINYIIKGVYFIVLVNVNDGTIRNSILNELKNIKEFDRDFSIMLSKTNQLVENKVDEVLEAIEDIVKIDLDYEKEILKLTDNGEEELYSIIKNINPETLFENLYLPLLKDRYFDVQENISYLIATLSEDNEQNEKEIKEIQNSIVELQKEKENLIKEAKSKYSDSQIKSILIDIKNEFLASKLQLAESFVSNPTGFNKEFENLSKYIITKYVRTGIENISLSLVDDITNKLNNAGNFVNSEMINQITDSIKYNLTNLHQNFNKFLQKKGDMTESLRGVFSMLAILTNVLAPVIEVVILFIPELLGGWLENRKKQKLKEEFNKKFDIEIVPKIIRELEMELPKIFNSQIQEIIINITKEFETKLKEKEKLVSKVISEKTEKIDEINQRITDYKKLEEINRELAKEYIFKG